MLRNEWSKEKNYDVKDEMKDYGIVVKIKLFIPLQFLSFFLVLHRLVTTFLKLSEKTWGNKNLVNELQRHLKVICVSTRTVNFPLHKFIKLLLHLSKNETKFFSVRRQL